MTMQASFRRFNDGPRSWGARYHLRTTYQISQNTATRQNRSPWQRNTL